MMTPFSVLSVVEGRKPKLDFILLSPTGHSVIFQHFVHNLGFCKLSVLCKSFLSSNNPIHNTWKFFGDNFLCQVRIDFAFRNLDIERGYQEPPVKSIRYIICFRQFIKGKHHPGIIRKSYNILIQNLGTDRFSTCYPLEQITGKSIGATSEQVFRIFPAKLDLLFAPCSPQRSDKASWDMFLSPINASTISMKTDFPLHPEPYKNSTFSNFSLGINNQPTYSASTSWAFFRHYFIQVYIVFNNVGL